MGAAISPVLHPVVSTRGGGNAYRRGVRDGAQLANGRQMSAAVGPTSRQHSSGFEDRFPGSSKRGDSYLRNLLIHGARSVLERLTEEGSVEPVGHRSGGKQPYGRRGVGRQDRAHRLRHAAKRYRLRSRSGDLPRRRAQRQREGLHGNTEESSTHDCQANRTTVKQVEPAPAEPTNVRGPEARKRDWELAHMSHHGPYRRSKPTRRADTREQPSLRTKERRANK